MAETKFPDGFPLTIGNTENPTQIIEDTLFIRACDQGILSVDLFDANLPARDAFKCSGLLPILGDYANHVIGRSLQFRFKTGYHESVMMDILEMSGNDQLTLTEAMKAAALRANRPAFYNKADTHALLDSRLQVRETSGIPLSVSLLMMDLALEASRELSLHYQVSIHGEEMPETLDLTPTVNLLQNVNAQPRIQIPTNLPARIAEEEGTRRAEHIIGDHLNKTANQHSSKG